MKGAEVDDVAARALGAMILEATALAIVHEGKDAEKALTTLAADSGLVLEVCAAILYASSFVAGVGDVAPEDLYAASLAWQPDADESADVPAIEDVDNLPAAIMEMLDVPAYTIEAIPAANQPAVCEWCDSTAIGIVNGYVVCFTHTDTAAVEEAHPEAPYRDENEDGRGEEE